VKIFDFQFSIFNFGIENQKSKIENN